MPLGTSSDATADFSRRLSVIEVILRLMPPPRAVLGMSTQ